MATMRADFLDRFSPYPLLVKATNKHHPFIAEMQPDELRLVIEQPAALHGVVFESGLVEEIIKEVQGRAGYLPLLEHTLNLLWERAVQSGSIYDRTLNIITYRELGGVRGALQKHVDKIYKALSEEERLIFERIFLKLVEIGQDVESGLDWKPVRRRAFRSEFSDPLEQKVLSQLIDQNLLVSDCPSEYREATVEIAHEVLLTSWSTLTSWIKQNQEAITLRNRLNDDTILWLGHQHSEKELWGGSRLEKAMELRKDVTFNQVLRGFSSDANQFIDASVGLRDQQRRRIILGLTGFCAVVMLLSIFAGWQWRLSEVQRQRAKQSQLEATIMTSETFLSTNQPLDSLVFAVKAGRQIQKANLVDPYFLNRTKKLLYEASSITKEYNRLQGHEDLVWDVQFSPDRKIIATASSDGSVKIWKLDGTLITSLPSQEGEVRDVQFSSDGKMIATVSVFKSLNAIISPLYTTVTIKRWHWNGTEVKEIDSYSFSNGMMGGLFNVQWLDHSLMFANVNDKGNVMIRQIDEIGIKKIATFGYQDWPLYPFYYDIKISPDGQTITVISPSNDLMKTTVKLWNRDGKVMGTLPSQESEITTVQFSHDSNVIATASRNGTVKLWNLDGLSNSDILHKYQNEGKTVQLSPDGETIATVNYDFRGSAIVRLWNQDGKLIANLTKNSSILQFSSDGKIIATNGNDETIKLWKPNGKEILVFHRPKGELKSIRFSPDSQTIATISAIYSSLRTDGSFTVQLRKQDGTEIKTLNWHKVLDFDLHFSPDSQTFATVSGGVPKLWKRDGNFIVVLRGHQHAVLALQFSPDGEMIATAGQDGMIKLWNRDGTAITSFDGDAGEITSLQFSPESQNIAATSSDGTVIILNWNLDNLIARSCNWLRDYLKNRSDSDPDKHLCDDI